MTRPGLHRRGGGLRRVRKPHPRAADRVTDQAYSSLELDYSAGTYDGYKAFYDVTGQAYTNEEVDVSASGQLEKVVYSGMTATPYSSVEQDYSGGALADAIYGFTDVTGPDLQRLSGDGRRERQCASRRPSTSTAAATR